MSTIFLFFLPDDSCSLDSSCVVTRCPREWSCRVDSIDGCLSPRMDAFITFPLLLIFMADI